MVKTQKNYEPSEFDIKKEWVNVLVIVLGLGVLISSIVFVTCDFFKEIDKTFGVSIDLKKAEEEGLPEESNSIYSTSFVKGMAYGILAVSILLSILYSLRFFKIKNKFIYGGKAVLILLLFVFTGLILPGYYYIHKLDEDIHSSFVELQSAEQSGMALIILSFLLGFTAIGSLVYFRKSELE